MWLFLDRFKRILFNCVCLRLYFLLFSFFLRFTIQRQQGWDNMVDLSVTSPFNCFGGLSTFLLSVKYPTADIWPLVPGALLSAVCWVGRPLQNKQIMLSVSPLNKSLHTKTSLFGERFIFFWSCSSPNSPDSPVCPSMMTSVPFKSSTMWLACARLLWLLLLLLIHRLNRSACIHF